VAIWIPEDKRIPGVVWLDLDDSDDNPCGYANSAQLEQDVVCRECGRPTLISTEVVFSLKTEVSRFAEQYGIEDHSCDFAGAMEGDIIVTCLSCGALEEGSSPFGIMMPIAEFQLEQINNNISFEERA
jgi:hypothetical protein